MHRRATVSTAVLAIVFALAGGASGGENPGERGDVRLKAEEKAKAAQKWAVVVGVNEYVDPALPALKYCVADAELVAKKLIERCGYEEKRVLLITDDQPKLHLRPLKRNLQVQVQDWLKRVAPGDTVLVFFAGHGFLDARGQGFLATQDCERENLGLTALRTDDLRDMLRQCKAAQKLLVLDCCHAGGDRGEGDRGASPEELGRTFRGAEGLVTLASCKKDETSREWPAKGQGLFTYFLAQGLSGEADGDGDTVVDSDELYQYCLEQVSLVGQRELNARQTPVRIIGEDVVGRFILARRPTVRTSQKVSAVAAADPVQHPGVVNVVALNRDGTFALSASQGYAALWDMRGDRPEIKTLIDDPKVSVFGVAFSPDGRFALTSGSPEGTNAAQLWELPSGRPAGPPLKHEAGVCAVAFSPDGRKFLTAGGLEARLWDTAGCRAVGPPFVHRSKVVCAAFSPDGGTVLTGGGVGSDGVPEGVQAVEGMEGEVTLWSVDGGRMVGGPLPCEKRVDAVSFGKENRFVTLSNDGQVLIWRPGNDGWVALPLGWRGNSFAAFGPDGVRLLTGGDGNRVQFWDAKTARYYNHFLNHRTQVYAAAFSPDGGLVLTGSGTDHEGLAQLWDAWDGHPVCSLLTHEKAVQCVAFSGDGRKVITGSKDKTARVWSVVPKEK